MCVCGLGGGGEGVDSTCAYSEVFKITSSCYILTISFVGEVYKRFIERLSQIFQDRLAVLGYIPGSFNVWEAKELLGKCYNNVTYQILPPLTHLLRKPKFSHILSFEVEDNLQSWARLFKASLA